MKTSKESPSTPATKTFQQTDCPKCGERICVEVLVGEKFGSKLQPSWKELGLADENNNIT